MLVMIRAELARAEVFSARLGSARGLFTVGLNCYIRKSQFFATIFFLSPKICHFKKKHNYLQQTRLKIIQFLHKVTNFWIKKKKIVAKKVIYKKNPAHFQLEH